MLKVTLSKDNVSTLNSSVGSTHKWRWCMSAWTGSCLPLWYLWHRPIFKSWHSYTFATAPRVDWYCGSVIVNAAEISKGPSRYSDGWWRPPQMPQLMPHQWITRRGGYSHRHGTISDSKASPNHRRQHPSSVLQLQLIDSLI